MTLHRKNARFSFVWISGLALAAATALAATGCSGDGGSGDSSTGGTGDSSGGTGGASGSGSGSGSGATTGGTGAASGTGTTGAGTPTSGSTGSSTGEGTSTGSASTSGSSSASSGGGSANGQCPADSTFCDGFDASALPAGTTYHPTYMKQDAAKNMVLDTAIFHAGKSSLQVKPGNAGYDWRMLGVATPGPTFWVRLYVRSDVDLGQAEHNAYFQAMTGDGDPNVGDNVEVAEQYCQVVLNLHDEVILSEGGSTQCGSGGALLKKNTWHCMEGYFDGTKGVVQIYTDGKKIIDKASWKTLQYKTFSFGFLGFHGPARTMWYDDVAVAPSRIGCGG